MKYNIKFIKGERLLVIGMAGMILSLVIPIYLRRNFDLNGGLMVAFIFSGGILSWVVAYFASKGHEFFQFRETGLITKKFGLVAWQEIKSLHLVDNTEHEIFIIKLNSDRKITISSPTKESSDREEFIAFKNELANRISVARESNEDPIINSYVYDGKGWRILGYIFIAAVISITFYALFELVIGDITVKKFGALTVVYGSALPMIFRIFRKELFGKS